VALPNGLSVKGVFRSGWLVLSARGRILAIMNLLYFGSIFAGALVAQPSSPPSSELTLDTPWFFSLDSGFLVFSLSIFLFNLLVSGLVLTTLSGLVFFVLPVAVLFYRALLWGVLLTGLNTSLFFASFPTLLLEGEGYVLAAVAGVNLGLSWFRPKWAYREEEMTRSEAVKRAFKDCLRIYIWVAILLLAGAFVEALTIILVF
jgi:hypothetical protein